MPETDAKPVRCYLVNVPTNVGPINLVVACRGEWRSAAYVELERRGLDPINDTIKDYWSRIAWSAREITPAEYLDTITP